MKRYVSLAGALLLGTVVAKEKKSALKDELTTAKALPTEVKAPVALQAKHKKPRKEPRNSRDNNPDTQCIFWWRKRPHPQPQPQPQPQPPQPDDNGSDDVMMERYENATSYTSYREINHKGNCDGKCDGDCDRFSSATTPAVEEAESSFTSLNTTPAVEIESSATSHIDTHSRKTSGYTQNTFNTPDIMEKRHPNN
jgi:hypothetical protein